MANEGHQWITVEDRRAAAVASVVVSKAAESQSTPLRADVPDPDVARVLDAAVSAVPGGVARPGQQRMAAAIATAIESGEHLLIQAGTGAGKSLGYLAPALASHRRTVVSTATLALQAQLVSEDLPRLADAVAPVLGRRPQLRGAEGPASLPVPCPAGGVPGRRATGTGRAVRRRPEVGGRGGPAGGADHSGTGLGRPDRDR